MTGETRICRLGSTDLPRARELNALFAAAFDDPDAYLSSPPDDAYLRRALEGDDVIALVGMIGDRVVGGLVAYVLHKLEQARSEIYVYDLAVDKAHRRRGVATALLQEVRRIAAEIGSWTIYVQADHGDEPAIALYEGLGRREAVLHFDIEPARTGATPCSI